jgi:hypothetical protein
MSLKDYLKEGINVINNMREKRETREVALYFLMVGLVVTLKTTMVIR